MTVSMMSQNDTLILGGGLVGLTTALALAKCDIASTVIDPSPQAPLTQPGFDGRASAIARTSWNLFSHIGVAERLATSACPMDRISVCEALRPGALDFGADAEHPATEECGLMGMMVPNRDLRAALLDAAMAEPRIDLVYDAKVSSRQIGEFRGEVALADGRTFAAPLLIGAEGRSSPLREMAGITLTHWNYRQHGIVAAIGLETSHHNTAFEIFFESGPLAILPLRDTAEGAHRASIVWTVPDEKREAFLALSDRAFAALLEKQMGGFLGKIELLGPRSSFPLGFHQASSMIDPRLVLVGDAAHGIHPIAGQGLNLGLRDAAALAAVLDDGLRLGLDIGDLALLQRYERWRRLDNAMMGMATDVLSRLFAVRGSGASAIRRLGLGAVNRSGLAKRFFIDEARGESGEMPPLLKPAA